MRDKIQSDPRRKRCEILHCWLAGWVDGVNQMPKEILEFITGTSNVNNKYNQHIHVRFVLFSTEREKG